MVVNWFGDGEDYCLNQVFWGEWPIPPQDELDRRWYALLPKLKRWGFNTLRLGFRMPDQSGLWTILDYDTLDYVLSILSSRGFKAVLCPFRGVFGSTLFASQYLGLVRRFKNDPRIAGWELMNEPYDGNSDPSVTTVEQATQVHIDLTKAIRNLGDTHPIVYCAGVKYVASGGWVNLIGSMILDAGIDPSTIVMDGHWWSYGNPATIQEAEAIAEYRVAKTSILKNQGFHVWIGELSPHAPQAGGGVTLEIEKHFVTYLINKCLENNYGFSLWLYETMGKVYDVDYREVIDSCLEASNYVAPAKTNLLPMLAMAAAIYLLS